MTDRRAVAQKALRQSMAWIHTWLGLLAGWILFAMFLTGTASYFRPEITRWMQPELQTRSVSPRQAAETAIAYLQQTNPLDEQWYIYLPDDRTVATRIFTRPRPDPAKKAAPGPRRAELNLDPASGAPLTARETRGGEHFYRFHFQLQLPHPWGRWLAGLCAMFMLGAIVSGVITHKRIFVDFFTLRWGKGHRSWLDAHNATAVLALPYHAMITYTGLITLVLMYMPWPIAANYANTRDFAAEAYGVEPEAAPSGKAVTLAPVGPMVDAAMRDWHGVPPRTIVVRNPNDAAATVTIMQSPSGQLNARTGSVTFSGASGARISASSAQGPARTTAGVLLGLHLAHFAGPALRWSFFILGLVGTAMVGTGLVMWTAKRRRPQSVPHLGFRIVERLNVGTIACLPAGMAAFLLANRLIPAETPGRAGMEVSAMYWVWFGLAAAATFRPVRRAWIETLAVSALAFAILPVVNAFTTDHGFVRSVVTGDWFFVSFDLAMLGSALLLAFAAFKTQRARQGTTRRDRRKTGANPASEGASLAT